MDNKKHVCPECGKPHEPKSWINPKLWQGKSQAAPETAIPDNLKNHGGK